jgi:hypothetical protein
VFDVKVKRPAMRITFAFGAGRGTVWGCFSLRYKLDMHVLERNIYGMNFLPVSYVPAKMLISPFPSMDVSSDSSSCS